MATAPEGGEEKKEQESWAELGIEPSAFESLERDFQEVLQELVGDKSLARFRLEWEKLHRALQKSTANEKRLIAKCRALNAEIVTNSAKVTTALKLSQEDQQVIASLKKEIEKAWKVVDTAREKEEKAKETIAGLRTQIDKLTTLVQDGAGISMGQETSVNELFKVKEDLQKEVQRQLEQINALRADMDTEREKVHRLQTEKSAVEHQVQVLQSSIRTKTADFDLQALAKKNVDQELARLKSNLASQVEELRLKEGQIKDAQQLNQSLKIQVENQRQEKDTVNKELEEATRREKNLQQELTSAYDACQQYNNINQSLHQQKQAKEAEIEKLKHKIAMERKMIEKMEEQMNGIRESKEEIKSERDTLKEMIKKLRSDVELEVKQKSEASRKVESLNKEMERLHGQQQKAKKGFDAQREVVSALEAEKTGLEVNVTQYKEAAQSQRQAIHSLEKERDRFRTTTMQLATKLLQSEEEVKIKDLAIIEKKKKLREAKVKLKQQQMLYEATRSDRNLYSKQLIEAQDTIAEYKRKFNILNHQIDQLKEEIVVKEQAIFTEHMTHMRVQKEFAAKQGQLAVLENQILEARKYQQSQEEEITKLKHIINEADTERMRQKKALDAARNERDILGTQLIRRNDELALLYEKINIQKYTLEKGEKQYAERVKEIRALKNRIKDNQHQLKILKAKAEHVESLKMAVYQLQRELLQERNRVKALSEELENPMNIHRWRKLEGTDPHKYELIQKIQTLQKRLIAKTEEVVEKELLIKQKEQNYLELKAILARQPGPEVAEQLAVYQANLKQKTGQLKAMAAELNMFQAQVNEYQYENDRLNRLLGETKKRYFDIKKKETQRLDSERAADPPSLTATADATIPRFTGGGFAI